MPTLSGFTVVLGDRVKETTQTTGTGTYSLDGAATGFRTFVAGIGSGNRTVYAAALGSSYEIGIGTVTTGAPATLSRDEILVSSNSNNAVSWAPGVKDIFSDVPAALASQIVANFLGLPDTPSSYSGQAGKWLAVNTAANALEFRNLRSGLRTPIATTSGTAHAFTSIPSYITRITLMFDGISTNGTSGIIVQLRGSGSFETTGYNGCISSIDDADTTSDAHSVGFHLTGPSSTDASALYSGRATLVLMNASTNLWAFDGDLGTGAPDDINWISTGTKSITGALTQVRLTTAAGTPAFDAGSFGMLEE